MCSAANASTRYEELHTLRSRIISRTLSAADPYIDWHAYSGFDFVDPDVILNQTKLWVLDGGELVELSSLTYAHKAAILNYLEEGIIEFWDRVNGKQPWASIDFKYEWFLQLPLIRHLTQEIRAGVK